MHKKVAGIVLAILMTVSAVEANIFVSWSAGGGFFFEADPNTGILGVDTGNSTIAQLLWSADMIPDAPTIFGPNFTSGDDQVIFQFTLTETSALFDDFAFFGGVTVNSDEIPDPDTGFIYGRIFQDANPDVGDWCYVGPMMKPTDLIVTGDPTTDPLPETYSMNTDNQNGNAIDVPFGDNPLEEGGFGMQVVPEPTTLALFGIGLAIIGLRRRCK